MIILALGIILFLATLTITCVFMMGATAKDKKVSDELQMEAIKRHK